MSTATDVRPSPSSLTKAAVPRRRRLTDLAARSLLALALLATLAPLVAVLSYTLIKGLARFDLTFLLRSMKGVDSLDTGGGAYHAIIGTLEQVGLAAALSIPLGLAVAVYLVEVGRGRLAASVRFFVDVMTGLPSIVAGLFIYTFWVLALDQGFSGLAAALALAVLMLPVIVRSAEEMLKLVPQDLREASYALGIPRWRTVTSVVLPSAASGITTGVMLAVARVTGETAPLLLTASSFDAIQFSPVDGAQSALPSFVFFQAGSAFDAAIDRAWAGALTLILLVILLTVIARVLSRRSRLVES